MRRTIAATVVTASLLGGGAVGAILLTPPLAGAEDATEDTTTADSAGQHRDGWFRTALSGLVEDGTITEQQADAVSAALAETRPGRGSHGRRGVRLGPVADVLGITVEELRTALDDGSTPAEVASANGSSAEDLVVALQAELEAHLAEEVAGGDLTQVEADERSAAAAERLTALVNGEPPLGGPGHRGGHGGPPPAAGDAPG